MPLPLGSILSLPECGYYLLCCAACQTTSMYRYHGTFKCFTYNGKTVFLIKYFKVLVKFLISFILCIPQVVLVASDKNPVLSSFKQKRNWLTCNWRHEGRADSRLIDPGSSDNTKQDKGPKPMLRHIIFKPHKSTIKKKYWKKSEVKQSYL